MRRSCWEILGLADTATVEEVNEAWRALRSRVHPDKGGDADTFYEAREAFEQASREARERPCPTCAGTGRTSVTSGFATLPMVCATCGGTGRPT